MVSSSTEWPAAGSALLKGRNLGHGRWLQIGRDSDGMSDGFSDTIGMVSGLPRKRVRESRRDVRLSLEHGPKLAGNP